MNPNPQGSDPQSKRTDIMSSLTGKMRGMNLNNSHQHHYHPRGRGRGRIHRGHGVSRRHHNTHSHGRGNYHYQQSSHSPQRKPHYSNTKNKRTSSADTAITTDNFRIRRHGIHKQKQEETKNHHHDRSNPAARLPARRGHYQNNAIATAKTTAAGAISLAVPSSWKSGDQNQIWSLGSHHVEYGRIVAAFEKTLPGATVKKIEIIQNKHLWMRYSLLGRHMAARYDNKKRMTYPLYHGTSSTDPKVIWNSDEGFDSRCSSKGLWGEGIYFASTAKYSNSYAYTLPSGEKQMFLADVLIGDSVTHKQDSTLRKPPVKPKTLQKSEDEHYDSVNGVTGGTKVFIIYKNEQVYPRCLITYTSQGY
mmetsp:Transcript_21735/g.24593  ORF Transcript_21735/g.24593 Transcript_21735/m.24593 type:complete len:362 (-) Transcript_21735:45-1130(-)